MGDAFPAMLSHSRPAYLLTLDSCLPASPTSPIHQQPCTNTPTDNKSCPPFWSMGLQATASSSPQTAAFAPVSDHGLPHSLWPEHPHPQAILGYASYRSPPEDPGSVPSGLAEPCPDAIHIAASPTALDDHSAIQYPVPLDAAAALHHTGTWASDIASPPLSRSTLAFVSHPPEHRFDPLPHPPQLQLPQVPPTLPSPHRPSPSRINVTISDRSLDASSSSSPQSYNPTPHSAGLTGYFPYPTMCGHPGDEPRVVQDHHQTTASLYPPELSRSMSLPNVLEYPSPVSSASAFSRYYGSAQSGFLPPVSHPPPAYQNCPVPLNPPLVYGSSSSYSRNISMDAPATGLPSVSSPTSSSNDPNLYHPAALSSGYDYSAPPITPGHMPSQIATERVTGMVGDTAVAEDKGQMILGSPSKRPSRGGRPRLPRQLISCDFCRGRKLKCDGQRPCGHCARRGKDCHFQEVLRKRGKGKKSREGVTGAMCSKAKKGLDVHPVVPGGGGQVGHQAMSPPGPSSLVQSTGSATGEYNSGSMRCHYYHPPLDSHGAYEHPETRLTVVDVWRGDRLGGGRRVTDVHESDAAGDACYAVNG